MNILIKNGKLLLKEGDGYKILKGDILTEDSVIRSVSEKPLDEKYADRIIDATDRLVMPGLINAHTHAYMSIFRNYADDLEFFEWLSRVEKVEDSLTPEDCYYATMLSVIEMIRTGTTCFADMHMRSCRNAASGPEGSCAGAANDGGIRAFLSRGFVGEACDEASKRRFSEFLAEKKIHEQNTRIQHILGPHAPYSCRPSLLEAVREYGLLNGMSATIHISESDAEVKDIIEQYGMSPVQYIESTGLFDIPVTAAHCVKITDEDAELLAKKNVSVSINPRSNMKLGNGFAPVPMMMEKGINICLGTDGSGSNNTQNMFQEMNMAGLVYKGAAGKAKCVDASDVVRFATEGGAKALGLEGKAGVLAEGAFADIILLDLNVPQFVPQNDLVSALVYSSNGSEVRTVIIDGRVVMEDNKLNGIDESMIFRQCEAIADRLMMKGERS